MNQTLKRFFGTIIVLLPVLVLLAIWVTVLPYSIRFANVSMTLLTIGRLTGLVGLALYAISLVLHVRIRPLSRIMDLAYISSLHHDLGSWALVLLLIHPLVLAISYIQMGWYFAARFLIPIDNLVNLAGLLALVVMALAMLVTYYYKANHTLWLWVHRSMLVAYFGAFLHLLFVTSDTSASPLLKYYLLFLMAAGAVAFAYQRISRL
jgi:predicted ferric reductase